MKKVIIQYKAVAASGTEELSDKVMDLILEGWDPFGSICVSVGNGNSDYDYTETYAQAMVKYDED